MARARLPAVFWLQAVAGAVLTLAFYLWNRFDLLGAHTTLATNLASIAVPAGAGAVAWRRSRAADDVQRRAWGFIAFGCWSWATGQAAWTWYESILGTEAPIGSLADAGYLLLIPLVAAGLLSFSRAPPAGTARLRVVLDGIIIALSWLFISWATALGSLSRQSEATFRETVVTALYPVGDLVLATIVVYILPRVDASARLTMAVLTGGLLALGWADSTFLYQTLEGTYTTGSPVDVGWIIGFQLIGLAAITPMRPQGAVEIGLSSRASAIVPLVPLTLAILVAAGVAVRDGGLVGILFWIGITNVGVVTLRQALTLFDQVGLQEKTQGIVHELQQERRRRTLALNTIAHDLLNPMTPIRLQLKVLGRKAAAWTPEERKGLDIVTRNSERVLRMASDLRDLANLEAGRLRVVLAPADLAQVASAIVATHRPVAHEHGLDLAYEGEASVPVVADRGRLEQVVENLVSNAIKFTPKDGRIRVRATATPATVRLEVQDSGRGLSEEERSRLFEPFSQVHEPSEARERGSGLGLANGKAIVEQHGGHMGVDSAGHGKGSTFWFEVPVRAQAPAASAAGAAAPRDEARAQP